MHFLKTPLTYAAFASISLLACKNNPSPNPLVYFNHPFPKTEFIDLSNHLGNELVVRSGVDSLHYCIDYAAKTATNIIYLTQGDTLYQGKAYKMEGIFYLDKYIVNRGWTYNAFMVKNQAITGFMDFVNQQAQITKSILGNTESMAFGEDSVYSIQVDRPQTHDLFSNVVKQNPAQRVIDQKWSHLPISQQMSSRKPIKQIKTSQEAPLKVQLVSSISSNENGDGFELIFKQNGRYEIQVYNSLGEEVLAIDATGKKAALGFTGLHQGHYLIKIVCPGRQITDTRKLIVANI